MAQYAINEEGARALRKLASDLFGQANAIIESANALKTGVANLKDGLGIYGDEIMLLTQKTVNILKSRRDSIELLAKKILENSKQIETYLPRGLLGAGNASGGSAGADNYDASGGCDSEPAKVLRLSPEQQRQNGTAYIERMLDIYRDNLLDRGAISIPSMDAVISSLRTFYFGELDKDIQGQPNGLYSDPDYNELLRQINSNPPPIAGVLPGEEMTFVQADTGHVNPGYNGGNNGFSTNCQTSVVVFEARLKGYDVEALPNTKGSVLETLSRDPSLAWIDPRTGKHPQYISDDSLRKPEQYLDFINKVIEPGKRYTIQFMWKGFSGAGHIVNIDKMPNGDLRIKDNQRGSWERSNWVGDKEVLEYLSRMRYSYLTLAHGRQSCVPRILRIDNMDFDYSIVNHIMKGTDR